MARDKSETEPTEIETLKAQIAQLQAMVIAQGAQQAGSDAVKLLAERSAPKENPNYVMVSPFAPAGVEKQTLSRPTFFCGARQREDELTPDEVALFNAITSDREVHGKMYGSWTAEVRRNGTQEELHVNVPAGSVDARMSLPSLLAVLGELVTGTVVKSPAEVQAELLAKVAELERRLAVA